MLCKTWATISILSQSHYHIYLELPPLLSAVLHTRAYPTPHLGRIPIQKTHGSESLELSIICKFSLRRRQGDNFFQADLHAPIEVGSETADNYILHIITANDMKATSGSSHDRSPFILTCLFVFSEDRASGVRLSWSSTGQWRGRAFPQEDGSSAESSGCGYAVINQHITNRILISKWAMRCAKAWWVMLGDQPHSNRFFKFFQCANPRPGSGGIWTWPSGPLGQWLALVRFGRVGVARNSEEFVVGGLWCED